MIVLSDVQNFWIVFDDVVTATPMATVSRRREPGRLNYSEAVIYCSQTINTSGDNPDPDKISGDCLSEQAA
jgi:hypothetical protein